jgi:hypothetical protein
MSQAFKEDHRDSNPGLHLLYVKWAVGHLTLIDGIEKLLFEQSNLNLLDLQIAVSNEREKLVKENAAYADASEVLEQVCNAKSHFKNEST